MASHINFLYSKEQELSSLTSLFDESWIYKYCTNIKKRGGRGSTLLFTHPNGQGCVLRHYFRGGFIGKIIKDIFFLFEKHAHRSFDEYNLLLWMRSNGLQVPKPIIAREQKYFGFLKQDIVIEEIFGSNDLAHIIDKRALTDLELKNIGLSIKKMFDLGVDHTDLNIRNILLDDKGLVYLIDFDKCFRCELSLKRKQEILERLLRSFNKEMLIKKQKIFFDEKSFEILRQTALSA